MEINEISGAIVNSAMAVHSALGPGLLEEPYKHCLALELRMRGFLILEPPYFFDRALREIKNLAKEK